MTVKRGTGTLETAMTIFAPSLVMPPFSYCLPTMKPVMFCKKIKGVWRWPQSSMKCVALSALSEKRMPLLSSNRWPIHTGNTCRSHMLAWSLSMDSALKSDDDSKTYDILVVDDDPATRRMVTSYFEEHNVSASSAAGRQDLSRHLAEGE